MKLHILTITAEIGVSSQRGYDAEVHVKVGLDGFAQTHKVIAEGFETVEEAQRIASMAAEGLVHRLEEVIVSHFNSCRDT
jgi:hypothetical protein